MVYTLLLQALEAPLPDNWREDVSADGTVYFVNTLTGASSWYVTKALLEAKRITFDGSVCGSCEYA